MKTLSEYINENLVNEVSVDTIKYNVLKMIQDAEDNGVDIIKPEPKKYMFKPKNREELKELINTLISERGNNADLNDIDVSSVKDMSYLFSGSNFNGVISNWDVSNVKNMSYMFSHAKFDGDISNWNVRNVKNMVFIFKDNPLQKNPPAWYKG